MLLCFTPEEQQGKNGPESEDKVSDSRRKETEDPLLLCRKMELPAAGEHVFAVESIEKKRSRKVCDKSTEGHFTCMHMKRRIISLCFPSPSHGLHGLSSHKLISKVTVQRRVHSAA